MLYNLFFFRKEFIFMKLNINENIENQNIARHYDYINDAGLYIWECDTFNIGYMYSDNSATVTMYIKDKFGSRSFKDENSALMFIDFLDSCSENYNFETILDYVDFGFKRG